MNINECKLLQLQPNLKGKLSLEQIELVKRLEINSLFVKKQIKETRDHLLELENLDRDFEKIIYELKTLLTGYRPADYSPALVVGMLEENIHVLDEWVKFAILSKYNSRDNNYTSENIKHKESRCEREIYKSRN